MLPVLASFPPWALVPSVHHYGQCTQPTGSKVRGARGIGPGRQAKGPTPSRTLDPIDPLAACGVIDVTGGTISGRGVAGRQDKLVHREIGIDEKRRVPPVARRPSEPGGGPRPQGAKGPAWPGLSPLQHSVARRQSHLEWVERGNSATSNAS
jgi:hypothetical protein